MRFTTVRDASSGGQHHLMGLRVTHSGSCKAGAIMTMRPDTCDHHPRPETIDAVVMGF